MDFKHPLRSAAALTLSAALLFCPAAQAEENRFTDVSETDWFYPYVMDLSEKKVINGYPDGTFQPQNTVTAGEALALIVTAAGNDSKTPTEDHWDIPLGQRLRQLRGHTGLYFGGGCAGPEPPHDPAGDCPAGREGADFVPVGKSLPLCRL